MRVAALLDRINHIQLLYFWTAVREGGVAKAADALHLAKATISSQIKKLEQGLGHELWRKSGRRMVVTPAGSVVYDYAERIFSLGEEMLQVLDQDRSGDRNALRIGVANGVPQLIAYRFVYPMIDRQQGELVCNQGELDDLLHELGNGRLHMVLSDAPIPPNHPVTAHNHLLDESPVALFGTPKLAAIYHGDLSKLEQAPLLMPMAGTELRRSLRRWLDEHGIIARIVGEFANTALLKIFGASGLGLFPAPISVAEHIQDAFGCVAAIDLEGYRERCIAITRESKPRHPLVADLVRKAGMQR